MITKKDLKRAVRKTGLGEWHGVYRGKEGREGIAVAFSDRNEVADFCVRADAELGMKELTNGDNLPFVETLGYGVIASWDLKVFSA